MLISDKVNDTTLPFCQYSLHHGGVFKSYSEKTDTSLVVGVFKFYRGKVDTCLLMEYS